MVIVGARQVPETGYDYEWNSSEPIYQWVDQDSC